MILILAISIYCCNILLGNILICIPEKYCTLIDKVFTWNKKDIFNSYFIIDCCIQWKYLLAVAVSLSGNHIFLVLPFEFSFLFDYYSSSILLDRGNQALWKLKSGYSSQKILKLYLLIDIWQQRVSPYVGSTEVEPISNTKVNCLHVKNILPRIFSNVTFWWHLCSPFETFRNPL